MKIEHIAFNVADPIAMSRWYETHLGLRTVKQDPSAPFTTFMADDSGRSMVEFYCNPVDCVPDYPNQHPLILHVAFVTVNPDEDLRRLLAAGATPVSDDTLADGSRIIMMRDPWGLAIQFCKRNKAMLSDRDLSI